MGANRKVQGEIDRVLKKVQEGVEVFDSIWNKEKFLADLKKEIRKLQRYRNQIKTWIQSSAIMDKQETKTKAFSAEELGQQPKLDPKEKAKSETRDWLNTTVWELESQIYSFEAEMEGLSVKKGKARHPRLTKLELSITRHKVTDSPRVYVRWEPEHPRDTDHESRKDEMFSITRELSNYCIEPTLMGLYEVMSKAGDDLQIIARDKKNKRKTEDMENDENVTGRTGGFFYEPVTNKRTTFLKCYHCRKPRHKIEKCFEYIRDLNSAKIKEELEKEGMLIAVMIAIQHQPLRKMSFIDCG
uniref:CCR4-Not complex, subunit 3/ 5 n=1 Tax=Tanacetum cinerariifolium TaxID=118510 RepID=A0A6L2KM84_TANCI|nr:CCR4-Not complex, subunit 3/ 5 [Tanacetum cinerariifolium]